MRKSAVAGVMLSAALSLSAPAASAETASGQDQQDILRERVMQPIMAEMVRLSALAEDGAFGVGLETGATTREGSSSFKLSRLSRDGSFTWIRGEYAGEPGEFYPAAVSTDSIVAVRVVSAEEYLAGDGSNPSGLISIWRNEDGTFQSHAYTILDTGRRFDVISNPGPNDIVDLSTPPVEAAIAAGNITEFVLSD